MICLPDPAIPARNRIGIGAIRGAASSTQRRILTQRRDLRGEIKASLRPEKRTSAHPFRLGVVEPLPVNIATESDIMLAMNPVEVSDVLVLRIVPIVRHEVRVVARGCEVQRRSFWY
jgi:hypothetical protein